MRRLLFCAIFLVCLISATAVFAFHEAIPAPIVKHIEQLPSFRGECTVKSMNLVDEPCIISLDEKNGIAYCVLINSKGKAYAVVVKKDGVEDYILWQDKEPMT